MCGGHLAVLGRLLSKYGNLPLFAKELVGTAAALLPTNTYTPGTRLPTYPNTWYFWNLSHDVIRLHTYVHTYVCTYVCSAAVFLCLPSLDVHRRMGCLSLCAHTGHTHLYTQAACHPLSKHTVHFLQ